MATTVETFEIKVDCPDDDETTQEVDFKPLVQAEIDRLELLHGPLVSISHHVYSDEDRFYMSLIAVFRKTA